MPSTSVIALPLGFFEWAPPLQAMTIALLTFVQEDTPVVMVAPAPVVAPRPAPAVTYVPKPYRN